MDDIADLADQFGFVEIHIDHEQNGDVLRDQLSHMRPCGFDAFAVREDKSAYAVQHFLPRKVAVRISTGFITYI